MNQGEAISILQQALYMIILLSAPVLVVGLVVGVVISVFQATTQINEQTLVLVPKIIAMFLSLIFFGVWMMNRMTDYTVKLFNYIGQLVR